MNNLDQPVSIESLFLANHVESVNGLLYISGGGWTTHTRVYPKDGSPPVSHLGIAVIIAVPWHRTNQTHTPIIEIRDEDGQVLANITAQLNVGRPPGMRQGTIQYANVGLPVDIVFPHAGAFEIVAHVQGIEDNERHWTFLVQDIPQPAIAR
jgi:hypothetical protein